MGNDLARITTDCLQSHILVAWLGVAEWIKPDGEMFVLAWSHYNVLGVVSFFI